jgi:hypothetical protein
MGASTGTEKMTAKFIQFFDILSGKEEEFVHFATKNYIPGIHEMGFTRIIGSWHVAAGEGPYCILESVADSVQGINRLLMAEEFDKLNHLLHFLITNYKTKILAPTGHRVEEIPGGVNYRFNHHYNIHAANSDDYLRFMAQKYVPVMETLGIKVIGRWYVAIGPGPQMVVEGSCDSTRQILQAIGSPEYYRLTETIFGLVDDFGSKILVPTGLLTQFG